MPSINLLPENFTIEANKKREKAAVYVLAVFFVLASASAYGFTEIEKRNVEEKTKVIDSEIGNVKTEIKNEIEKSDLLSSEYNKKDIEKVLGEHVYSSKGMSFLKYMIIQGVYLTSWECDPATAGISMKVAAKDYDTLVKQMLIFEDSFWVESSDFSGIKKSETDGSVEVNAKAVLRKDIFSFHEQYWDFGLGVLSAHVNRFLDISSYSVNLQETPAAANSGNTGKKVIVSFEGKAYDKVHLDEFEKSLNEVSEVNKPVVINRFNLKDDKPGVINFRGSLSLNY
ncbi:MAG: hypothetical protein WCQ96_04950 [Patescibacteria group bacterium]